MNENGAERARVRTERALKAYLKEAPFSAAIWRSNEAAAFASVELPRPMIDIGCGFGEFGRIAIAQELPIDLGIDMERGEIERARDSSYLSLVQCDARRLPVAPGMFASAISVSTLEHIPDVEGAISEVARVLRPGGVFAFSVPTDRLSGNLFGSRTLGVASRRAAEAYGARVNRMLTHVNVWPAERWTSLAAGAGLRVEEARAHVSPGATMAFELLLPAAFASRMFKRATGRRIPHPDVALRVVTPLARRLVSGASARGSNLLVVARKP